MNIGKTLCSFLFIAAGAASAADLDFGRIRPDEISVYVQELDSGKVIADHRADALMNPASTMKLITAFAAFRALGKDYRWTTELKSSGNIANGVLNGDIYWVGSGDPVLDQDGLTAMQQQLRDKGIRKIRGQIALDRSLWGDVKNSAEFASDAGRTFMTPPDPNMLAYKTVALKPERNALGDIEIATNPPLPEIPLENKIVLVDGSTACKSPDRYIRASYTGGVLRVSGKMPESCLSKEMLVNMLGIREFAGKSFVNQWRQAGGEISDGLKTAAAPNGAKTLAAHQSKPLADILADMNIYSNNLIARSVFLKLGRDRNAETALSQARRAVRLELGTAGVDAGGLVMENGAGLSRQSRLSAKMMAQLLEKAYFSPFSQEFIQTLPRAGMDGTLKTRFKQAGANLRLKTGTLKNVRALAGYKLGSKPLLVVAIINSPNSDGLLKDLDKLVSKIALPGGESWFEAQISCEKRQRV
ncbi:D-alanyl-D-alanine carboxypeptidase/D-alanyl-D-alanine endopeptidase [Neisseria chenwenguii]|uniref:D-alanyl-D-alanine carboxypeptidase/D-alanyl-D-alanine-endopeptidase n=1 Tax=Neisseria chenwenguii TaxID=1853278 RepID=A0A220S497_9NEIS|nr:D-alanyl-D-alanine carboxypeptidase/D-alanyl-D-alanine-endopeptidase [Neisseria chenwenguii]ASK28168.1 D-alanyl-D-alanine carboxypeptidase/D-alanyl-D-alanine-endopeptidase [Neisseria chenwenguii]ROV57319.1 D-alanyl-D-alanine carboxypeptidase/D-alanyl-D-alanine-endopeptidase [Neisseria chenwenguii]